MSDIQNELKEGVNSGAASVEGKEPSSSEKRPESAPTDAKKGEAKLFTQAEIDAIVSKRVNEVTEKFKDASQKAETLDRLLEDERFGKFLDGLSDKPQKEVGEDLGELIGELDDPKIAKVIEKVIKSELKKALPDFGSVQLTVADIKAKLEVEAMMNATNDSGDLLYPLMKDKAFREEMATIADKNPRLSLEDLYVKAERPRLLEKVRETNTHRQQKTKDAELLESKGGSRPASKTDKAPRFKSPSDAVEAVLQKLGKG